LPNRRPAKELPLIVMPHGGPWVRDVWGFDPLVQLLANRGYAVLQMNYRGSPGFGAEFSRIAKHEIGRGIQDDIEDGARWAIAQHLADPKRVAIVGISYGGYSALFGLAKSPGLYRCGISIAGVTDWLGIIKGKTSGEYKFAYQHWVEQIGDPRNDAEFLRSISPIDFAGQIKAPLLVVQGKEDHTVPPKQARLLIAAMEKAGRPPESLFLSGEGHFPTHEKSRVELFKHIEEFLARNLGPEPANP
jgi:dipeptidyl aminopeptidase/acylaminoacyl peptidase